MSNDLTLSRRADAAGWKWQAGALAINANGPVRVDGCDSFNEPFVWGKCQWSGERVELWVREMPLPDFNDAATRGVLLQQVRERRNAPHGYVTCGRSRCASQDYAPGVWDWYWAFWDDQETFVASGDSETAALIAAMEAAPKEKANG